MTRFALPTNLLSRVQQQGAEIEQRIDRLGGRAIRVDPGEVVTGRAGLLGLDPPTRISSGGATRLLAAADGWCALTLGRAEDVEAVPALLELPDVAADPWPWIAAAVEERPAADFVARARLLDMPAAVIGEVTAAEPKIVRHSAPAAASLTDLLVVDLSSMWAGPLCGRLLAAAGATVVKVETTSRPDGTRSGHRGFFDWMNGGKLSYSIDFDSDDLVNLLRAADVVIEGSRPAALARRGLAADMVPARAGRVWLRISGYGNAHPNRIAFGDDAAVAGGLVSVRDAGPVFCGDAIADPLTGLAATAAVLDALSSGGGVIIEVSMAAVAAMYAGLGDRGVRDCEARPPELPAQSAPALGVDNARVRELVEARLVAC